MWNAQSHQIWQKSRPVAFNLASDTSSATNAAPNSTALFGLGAFGAFLKEFFRWRTLAERKKTDLFLKPEFIFFRFIFIVSGAALGYIFGSWSPSGPMGPGRAQYRSLGNRRRNRRARSPRSQVTNLDAFGRPGPASRGDSTRSNTAKPPGISSALTRDLKYTVAAA